MDEGPGGPSASEPAGAEAFPPAEEPDRSLSALVPAMGVIVAVFIVVGSLIDLHVW